MINISITEDKKNLKINYTDNSELVYMNDHFTRHKRDSKFNPTKNSVVHYFRTNNTLPIQLYDELIEVLDRGRHQYRFDQEAELYRVVEYDHVIEWCKKEVIGTEYQDYDMGDTYETVYTMIKNKYSRLVLSTSYGKSITLFLVTKYLIDHKLEEKILIVTSKPQLANQFMGEISGMMKNGEDFYYSAWKATMKKRNTKVIITNFMLAVNIKKEFMDMFTCIMFDECHRCSAYSYKQIYESAGNVTSTSGCTGSLREDGSAEDFQIMSLTGATKKIVTKKDIIASKRATGGRVSAIILDYADRITKHEVVSSRYGTRLTKFEALAKEKEAVFGSVWRMQMVAKMLVKILQQKGNGLAFFKITNNGYADRMITEMKRIDPSKKYFYVDQTVPVATREAYCSYMESNNDAMMFGTYDTIGTGTSIKNLHWGAMVEPTKSPDMIEQVIGRFMRLHKTKEEFVIYDIVDDMRSIILGNHGHETMRDNFLYTWFAERSKIYNTNGFKIKKQIVNKNGTKVIEKKTDNPFKQTLI
jgi:hypothetical protein